MVTGRDQPWARTPAARAARELVICGVFGSIVATYSRRRITGLENLEPLATPVIFVANHCSHVDTPVLLLSLPASWRRRTAVAAAADYFYTKRLLAGVVSLAFGTVPLERRGQGADAAHIGRLLDGGWNLLMFAEGTRSRDGRVGRMRSGAAVLAAEHSVPIVPVYISGTHAAMPIGRPWMVRPEGGGRFARHTTSVTFGAPLEAGALSDRSEAMARVRRFMQSCGAELIPDADPDADSAAAPPASPSLR
ncbi:MAG: 1-acyl-sn-glycerol-3-phosphate acyltransferase [Actinomycetota bacterium]|nr:1-acyl-sn-glycerol-3-phosphate acyltransferase [Actinomycetota bacterium]